MTVKHDLAIAHHRKTMIMTIIMIIKIIMIITIR